MARAASLLLALALGGVAGCFTDSTPSQICAAGAAGCDCRPDDTCDQGLECRPPGVCVEADCTPGRLGCVCDEGSCDAPNECNELGACVEPSPMATDSGTTSASSGVTSTTVDSAEGSGSSSISTTVGPTTVGPTSTGPNDTCQPCLVAAETVCAGLGLACDSECQTAVDCIMTCGADEPCTGDCCVSLSHATQMFIACMADECPTCSIAASCTGNA